MNELNKEASNDPLLWDGNSTLYLEWCLDYIFENLEDGALEDIQPDTLKFNNSFHRVKGWYDGVMCDNCRPPWPRDTDAGMEQYLDSLVPQFVEQPTRDIALSVWRLLSSFAGYLRQKLPAPDAAPTPNCDILLVWAYGEQRLEAEILHNGMVEFFFLDKQSGETWSHDIEDISRLNYDEILGCGLGAKILLFKQ